MLLFVYSCSDKAQANGYDDCAVCRVWTLNHAIKKFKKPYKIVNTETVKRLRFNKYGIAVISDY